MRSLERRFVRFRSENTGDYYTKVKRRDSMMSKNFTHHYPCDAWLEERSCAFCRQIADELSYLTPDERRDYGKRWRDHDE